MSMLQDTALDGQEVDLQGLLSALTALRHGDFTVRLPAAWTGLAGKVGDTFNDVMDQLEGMSDELERISRVVGKEGKTKQRAYTGSHSGAWAGTIESVNNLISDLVHPTSETARVIGAVAKGDLSKSVPLDYISISSGLGNAPPVNVIILPVVFKGQGKAALEFASFERFSPTHQMFLDQLAESIGIVFNTIEANMRTEDLLKQLQSLVEELGSRQDELQQTNEELQEKAQLLADLNVEAEQKNQEVEQARQALEEKAEQLALTSKYKSEFLANMSHELRTLLNSLLILSDQLSKNPDGNLTPRQTDYAKTIHSSGNDLLMLINDILDLSKIESGTVVLDVGELRFADLRSYVERTFRHVAEAKGVEFRVQLDPLAPRSLTTDSKRLQQIIKNLLSNAFKFTHRGTVCLRIGVARDGWQTDNDALNSSDMVLAFSVKDSGIGIPAEKQQIIFEAFQQADGSTSLKYGGTGLGLAISRETARLLGGEIRLNSAPDVGSEFTLYLPQAYVPQKVVRRAVAATSKTATVGSGNGAAEMAATIAEPASADGSELTADVLSDRASIQPDDRQEMIRKRCDSDIATTLKEKKVLIVDDDIRNIFALTSVLERYDMATVSVETGRDAINLLQAAPDVDVVLMDIMMPEMDGIDTTCAIRKIPKFKNLPIVAVTAKAMKGDREKCIEAGAWDYLSKPVDPERMLSVLRAWLSK